MECLFPKSAFRYYDLYALRCENWVEGDFLPKLRNEIALIEDLTSGSLLNILKRYLREDRIRRSLVYRNMRILFPWSPLINVKSAFGALGIYKKECFLLSDYGLPRTGYSECEHVHFHADLNAKGMQLVINPRMINSWVNPYNLNKLFIVRLLRFLSKN